MSFDQNVAGTTSPGFDVMKSGARTITPVLKPPVYVSPPDGDGAIKLFKNSVTEVPSSEMDLATPMKLGKPSHFMTKLK